MSRVIGIDLGTTSSRVAVMHNGRPVIIENSEGQGTTPSHVAITADGRRLVGEAARRYALHAPHDVAFAVKRLIGRRFQDQQVQRLARFVPYRIVEGANGDAWVELSGQKFSPSQLSAFTLMKLKQTAEAFLGEPVMQAIITVPAYFSDSQRQATKDAGVIAGLEVLRIISEPVAAALYYGFGKNEVLQSIAVYDLGGGTFDVSILEIGDGVFEVKSTSGDTFLGGEDFDYVIAEHLTQKFALKHGKSLLDHPMALQRLKQAAETAKIGLSSSEFEAISLPFILHDGASSYHFDDLLTRRELERLLDPLVERTIAVCADATKSSGFTPAEIDAVVLVGGSTRLPIIQRKIAQFFGKPPMGGLRREDVVALGAAIQGGVLTGSVKDVLLLDAIPFSLGIESIGGVFSRIIERNTFYPTKKSQVFSTSEDGQRAVSIRVFQGDREMAADNVLIGAFELNLPPAPRGLPQIEVTFDIDANGIVHVSAKDKSTGKEQSVRIKAHGGLTEQQIGQMSRDAEAAGVASVDLTQPAKLDATPTPVMREEASEPPPVSVSSKAGAAAAPTGRPSVFISYAHEDAQIVRAIEKALAVLVRNKKIELWVDRKIETGDLWEKRIFSAIENSNIVVLLISNDFLSSEFIAARELPAIFAEKERRRLALIPIIVRPCPFELHEDLGKFQFFNNPEAPFAKLKEWEVEEELSRLAREINKGTL